jgi:T5SS/PEP-CTERM-associated repeat protein
MKIKHLFSIKRNAFATPGRANVRTPIRGWPLSARGRFGLTNFRLSNSFCIPASVWIGTWLFLAGVSTGLGADYVRTKPGDFSNTDWYKVDPNPSECNEICCNGMCGPPAGPPGAGDNASLNGRAVTASGGSVMNLGGGTLTLGGAFRASSVSGLILQGSGTLTANSNSGISISGGHLVVQSDISKSIDISKGGSEVASSLASATGGAVSSGGSLTVNSTVINLNLALQGGGTGRIANITNSHGTGGVLIDGAGSALTVDQTFSIKADFLDLSDGGALTVNSQLVLDGAIENGQPIGGGGHWQGKGTKIRTSKSIFVGDTATSDFSLGVDSGAVVQTGNAHIGAGAGAFGTVSLADAGTLWEVQSGAMAIGDRGTGNFTIEAGAKLLFDQGTAFAIGLDSGSHGTLAVTGSTVDASAALMVIGSVAGSSGRMSLDSFAKLLVGRDFTIGESGSGGLTISNASRATINGAKTKFLIGNNAGSSGGVSVSDNAGNPNANGNSLLAVAGPMTVGVSGVGFLGISAGGAVSVTDSAGLTVGAMSGSTGAINVARGDTRNGEPPKLTLAGPLLLGDAGTGSLTVDGAAQLTLAPGAGVNLILGNQRGGSGTVTLQAFDFVDNNPILIGKSGHGTINAINSIVQLFGFSAPLSPGGQGTITVDQSFWTNDFNIYLGSLSAKDPPSTLLVKNNGTMRVGQRMTVFQSGTATIDATGMMAVGSGAFGPAGSVRVSDGGILSGYGRVQGKVIVGSGGKIYPGNSPGVLTIEGSYKQDAGSTYSAEIGGTGAGDFDQINLTGAGSLGGTLSVRLVNGFTPSIGQTFPLLKASSVTGAFASISPPSQAGIALTSDATGVTATITSVVAGAPVISSATTVNTAPGAPFNYQINATNNPTSFGAANLPAGLTVNHSTGLISGTPNKAGAFIVPIAANNAVGSGQADLTIIVDSTFSIPASPPSNLLNISTRMKVLSGNNVLIGGFIVTGSQPKKVMIRALGLSLPVSGVLADPVLELHDSSKILATNDNWKVDDKTGQSQEAAIAATTIPPKNDLESALIATLPANNSAYTAIVRGKNGGTGVGQVEVYDLGTTASSQLANISTRGFVDSGDNVMIGGIIAGPNSAGSTKVLLRAIGPSLGISGALANPTLELHDGNGTTIATNDNWKVDDKTGASQQAEIEATKAPPKSDLESALIHTVAPGNYTAIVRGKNNTTGIGLVEVYNLQ